MRRIVPLLGLALAASTALIAVPVSAAGTPDLGLKVPAHAHANKPTTVSWHARNRGSDTVVLQGYNGNTQSWGTFRHLHGTSGKTTFPAEPIGIYDFRIAAYSHSGKLVTAVGRKLHVFGTVKWKTLFQPPKSQAGTYGSFHYVFSFFSNEVDYTALKVSDNPCSSVHIEYIPGTENPNESVGGEGTVKVGRHGRSTVTSQAAAQHVGTVNASLPVGKSWTVNLSEPGNGTRLFTWYFNGTAVCDQTRVTTYSYNQN
ncbi:MAG TPA: hypothetical protein VG650_17020 [Mycobacteriales bacterium]|nr:hypothetical protein [Mycobacteriales bacterium]